MDPWVILWNRVPNAVSSRCVPKAHLRRLRSKSRSGQAFPVGAQRDAYNSGRVFDRLAVGLHRFKISDPHGPVPGTRRQELAVVAESKRRDGRRMWERLLAGLANAGPPKADL